MSLLLAGLIVATAGTTALLGAWRTRRQHGAPPPSEPSASGPRPSKVAETSGVIAGFPCQLGDVVMRATGEEAWLAGGLVLSEGKQPVAALFVAPEAGADIVLYAKGEPSASLSWLAALSPDAILVGGEPPSVIEHEGLRFERKRRLPLSVERIGVSAPDLGAVVVAAEYASAGSDRVVVLKGDNGQTRAFRGVELESFAYEVIASGRATL